MTTMTDDDDGDDDNNNNNDNNNSRKIHNNLTVHRRLRRTMVADIGNSFVVLGAGNGVNEGNIIAEEV